MSDRIWIRFVIPRQFSGDQNTGDADEIVYEPVDGRVYERDENRINYAGNVEALAVVDKRVIVVISCHQSNICHYERKLELRPIWKFLCIPKEDGMKKIAQANDFELLPVDGDPVHVVREEGDGDCLERFVTGFTDEEYAESEKLRKENLAESAVLSEKIEKNEQDVRRAWRIIDEQDKRRRRLGELQEMYEYLVAPRVMVDELSSDMLDASHAVFAKRRKTK